MIINGYALNDVKTKEQIARWPSVPERVQLSGGDIMFGVYPGWTDGVHELVEVSWEEPDPS
jgi:hypothetical protein